MKSFSKKLLQASLIVVASLASHVALAGVINTQILKVENPPIEGAPYQVLSTADGRVYALDPDKRTLRIQLSLYASKRYPVELEVNDEDEVTGVRRMSDEAAAYYLDSLNGVPAEQLLGEVAGGNPEATADAAPADANVPAAIAEFRRHGFQPSILTSMDEVNRLWREQRPLDHDSQCHQRAMVWTHDWWLYHRTADGKPMKSMKVMMFFTERFRRTYVRKSSGFFGDSIKPYKWWYHTAPMIYLGDQELVMDPEFTERPMTVDDWSHFFLSDNIGGWNNTGLPRLSREQTHCRVMTRYQEYDHQNGQDWCLIRKFPMYYMQPNSIEALDCDPTRDPASGRPDTRLSDGRLKYPCFHRVLTDWDKWMVENAYSGAGYRDR